MSRAGAPARSCAAHRRYRQALHEARAAPGAEGVVVRPARPVPAQLTDEPEPRQCAARRSRAKEGSAGRDSLISDFLQQGLDSLPVA